MLALAESANLPLHFIHGRAALSTADGQLAAALSEILLRGFSRMRIVRMAALLRSRCKRFEALPGDWWRAVPEGAPLLDAARWIKAIAELPPPASSGGNDHRSLLKEIIETLGKGLKESAAIGEGLLEGKALRIWRKALTEGPPAALDITLTGLRVDGGVEPGAAMVWGPASAIAAVPPPSMLAHRPDLAVLAAPRRRRSPSSQSHHRGGASRSPACSRSGPARLSDHPEPNGARSRLFAGAA